MNKIKRILKRFLLWIGATTLTVLATACGQKQDDTTSIQLDMAQMLETAAQASEDDTVTAENPELRETLGCPERYADSFTDKSGKKQVIVDAQVYVPDATELSVVEVFRSELTQNRVDRVVNALMKGELLSYSERWNRPDNRTTIQIRIDALDALVKEEGGSKGDAWNEQMQSEREYLLSVLDKATDESAPITGYLTHPVYGNAETGEGGVMSGDTLLVTGVAASDAGYETLRLYQGRDSSCVITYVREPDKWVSPSCGFGLYMSKSELALAEAANYNTSSGEIRSEDLPNIPVIETTQEQALAAGDELMSALDITDIACVDAQMCWGGSFDPDASGVRGGMSVAGYGVSNPLRCVWRLRYTRSINGMETTYCSNDCQPYIDPEDDKEVLPACGYEQITVYIDDTGIVGFRWASPCEIGDVVVDNAFVLPFDEIMQVFEGTFFSANDFSDMDSAMTFEIDEVRFGYARIREVDVYDTGVLVPAWDFFGTATSGSDGVYNQPQRSWFTINAIDGSIIDRQQGY